MTTERKALKPQRVKVGRRQTIWKRALGTKVHAAHSASAVGEQEERRGSGH